LKINRWWGTAIHGVEPPVDEIEPRVAHGHKALELDQLPRDFGVRERDDILALGQGTGFGQGDEAAEGLQEMTLRGRAEQRGGNTLPHHVPDDDVEPGIAVIEEIVEGAGDWLGGDGQGCRTHAGEILRRLLEKQGLLDPEADL